MGLKAAVQALKKAEPLKDKVQRCKDLLNDNDAWLCQQQLQKIYQQVLILDLEYALDRKVEQELWNLGFKNYIAMLQSQAKDRKNPKRGESQAMLSWCLEAASGFYLTLLQEICTAFDLDLPFRRRGYVYGCTSPWKAVEKLSAPHKSSCFYACQYCLVHLGDIARYRTQNKQAELFYRHAVSLSPSSGQPYNQLALLEASRGDKLSTVFHYARSIAVKHPFPVATTNLAKTLSSALNDNSFNIEEKTKLTSQEYLIVFLKLHAVLHNLGSLTLATKYSKLLTETLTALIATESFSSWRLVQMLVINLYALEQAAGIFTESTDLLSVDQLCSDEKFARDCILDVIAGSLSALLLPVYTIKNAILDYFALPTIKLCLEWIRLKPRVLKEAAFTSRLQIWPSLCVLLNGLQTCVSDFKYDQYDKVPLPEDRDLQGFLPLGKSFEPLRFTNTDLEGDSVSLNKLRAIRILQSGRQIAQYQINGIVLITVEGEILDDQKFTSMSEGVGPSNELMRELEELSLNKEKQLMSANSPVPSESASSKGSSEMDLPEILLEKRVGILKPQGSLERSRDTLVNNTDITIIESPSTPTIRKPRQNVAMQAIMRRAETEKQVTFKNVSPVITEEEDVKKSKLVATPPMTIVGNKASQPTCSTQNVSITVQNRSPLMPAQAQNQQKLKNQTPQLQMQPQIQIRPQLQIQSQSQLQTQSLVLPSPINQPFSTGEQINQGISQFQLGQGLPLSCFQNQSFNVQNPAFSKNFIASQIPDVTSYQIQGQYQQSLNQNRLRQRENPGTPQNSSLQQSINLNSTQQNIQNLSQSNVHNLTQQNIQKLTQQNVQNLTQQNIQSLTQNAGLQSATTNPNLQQQTLGIQQQTNLGIHQKNLIATDPRNNVLNIPNQLNMPVSGITNSILSTSSLSGYQKNIQQGGSLPNISDASLNPSDVANLQLGFNHNYGQNSFNQMQQKQVPSTSFPKNPGQFAMTNQANLIKGQQAINSYSMFHGYENKDFNPWNEPQPPQPPLAWWGTPGQAQLMHGKETPGTDAFQNWGNSPSPGNMISRVPPTPGNNYTQNPFHGSHYNARGNHEETRTFEVDQKQQPTMNTGNTYSLFSGNTWGLSGQTSSISNQDQMKTRLNQQSLWSGPGPSPLERLLEQQKSLREGGT